MWYERKLEKLSKSVNEGQVGKELASKNNGKNGI